MVPLQSRAENWKVSFSGGSGLIGGSTVDVMVIEANRRVSIVTVGVALDGLRGGRFGWEKVDVVGGGPV